MRIPNVSQRKDSANSERIQQFCTCKKRNLLCCAIGSSAAGGFAKGGRTTQKRRTQATGRSKFSSPVSRHNPFAYRLVRWVVGITCWLEKSLNRELDASGRQLAVSH